MERPCQESRGDGSLFGVVDPLFLPRFGAAGSVPGDATRVVRRASRRGGAGRGGGGARGGGVGAARRVVVVGRSTATLIFAGRVRSSGIRRMVPRTTFATTRGRGHRAF